MVNISLTAPSASPGRHSHWAIVSTAVRPRSRSLDSAGDWQESAGKKRVGNLATALLQLRSNVFYAFLLWDPMILWLISP